MLLDHSATEQNARARLLFRLPLDPARLLRARQRIRDYLDQHGVDIDVSDAVVLAIEEAMTNAVRHSEASGDLEVRVRFEGRDLHAEVDDEGKGFDLASFDRDREPDLMTSGGRGLFLIAHLMDGLELECDGGLKVRMLKRAALPQSSEVSSLETGIVEGHLLEGTRYRERRLRLVVEELGEGYAALDWEYRFTYANEVAFRLYGRGPDGVLGHLVWELFPQIEEAPVGRAIRDSLELGSSGIVEFESPTLGRWIECRVYPTGSGASLYLRDIEGRKRKEAERDQYFDALIESEERFRTLFDSMTEGVALHEIVYRGDVPIDYRIVEVNPAYERQTGLSAKTVRGRLATEVYGTKAPPYLVQYAAVAESGQPQTFETYFEPMRRHFHITVVSLGPGRFATVFEDITERMHVEEALQHSERRYRELVQNANSAIIRWSGQGTITFLNEYAQELFGWSAEEAVGKDVTILVPERQSDGRDVTGLVGDILEHPERYAHNTNQNVSRDGRRLWMTWANRAILDEDGKVEEILAVGTDISELKQAEDALRASEERYRGIVELADEELIVHPDGTYSYASKDAGAAEAGSSTIAAGVRQAVIAAAARLRRNPVWALLLAWALELAFLVPLDAVSTSRNVLGIPGSVVALIGVIAGAVAGPWVGVASGLGGGVIFYLTVADVGDKSSPLATAISTGIWVAAALVSSLLAKAWRQEATKRKAAAVALARAETMRQGQVAQGEDRAAS